MKKLLIVIACVLGLGFVAANAEAVLILDDTTSYYVGSVVAGIPPSDQLTYLQYLITIPASEERLDVGGQDYYRSLYSDPLPVPTAGVKIDADTSPLFEFDSPTYLVGKYDQDNAGTYVWLVPADTEVRLPNVDPVSDKYGLSNYGTYTTGISVPDGAMTLVLLSGALFGIEALRRRFSA
jgi:hypothetical protein